MIYLMRHGEIAFENKMIGQSDLPLTKRGEAQMAAWRAYFRSRDIKAVYSGTLGRSVRSAEIVCEGTGLAISACPELNEIHLGKWDGEKIADIKNRFFDEWQKRGENIASYQIENGERFLDLSNRVVPFFEKLARQAKDDHVLIMGHAGVNRMILCHVLNVPICNLFQMAQNYACLNTIETDRKTYRLINLNLCMGLRGCQ